MKLSDLRSPRGARTERKRVGRGHGSGHVKTAGRGQKGQKSRSGGSVGPRFEGGQTPIQQQLPYKRGFTNIWKARFNLVNIQQLESAEGLKSGAKVSLETLIEVGLLRDTSLPLKVLGTGEISKLLHITANKVSEGARQKIEAAGGSVTLIEEAAQPRRSKGRTEAPVRAAQARKAAQTEAKG